MLLPEIKHSAPLLTVSFYPLIVRHADSSNRIANLLVIIKYSSYLCQNLYTWSQNYAFLSGLKP